MSETIFLRTFSNLGTLQQAHALRYHLLTEPGQARAFGIAVDRLDADWMMEARQVFHGISASRGQTLSLLRYLYENCVDPQTARAVLQDLPSLQA